jgi:hypothetical protein
VFTLALLVFVTNETGVVKCPVIFVTNETGEVKCPVGQIHFSACLIFGCKHFYQLLYQILSVISLLPCALCHGPLDMSNKMKLFIVDTFRLKCKMYFCHYFSEEDPIP